MPERRVWPSRLHAVVEPSLAHVFAKRHIDSPGVISQSSDVASEGSFGDQTGYFNQIGAMVQALCPSHPASFEHDGTSDEFLPRAGKLDLVQIEVAAPFGDDFPHSVVRRVRHVKRGGVHPRRQQLAQHLRAFRGGARVAMILTFLMAGSGKGAWSLEQRVLRWACAAEGWFQVGNIHGARNRGRACGPGQGKSGRW